MKDSVTKFNFDDAFKALDEIEIPVAEKGIRANRVNLKESLKKVDKFELLFEDFYDVNNADDMNTVSEEREAEVAKAKLARIEKIVDLDAETEDDILPSYVGKTIIQCPQCMTLFYKDAEDIVRDEENPDVVNVNEVCQHCGNESGYDVIGKVAEETETAPGDELGTDDFSAEVGDGENDIAIDDGNETTEEAPAEEGGEVDELSAEADLDSLDLDTDLEEEPAEEEETNESLHTSKLLKKIEDDNELKTENESEKLTLNEDIEDNLDDKLKAHEEYIKELRDTISELEKKLAGAKNEQIKTSIQNRIDAARDELEAALPEAVKVEAETEELPDATEAGMEDATDNTSDETEATNDETEEAVAEEPKEVKEALNEAHQLSAGEKIIEENDKEILVKTTKSYALYQVFNKSSVLVGSIQAIDDKSAKEAWQKRDFMESLNRSTKKNNALEEDTSKVIPDTSEANINNLFGTKEFTAPISEEEVTSYLNKTDSEDTEVTIEPNEPVSEKDAEKNLTEAGGISSLWDSTVASWLGKGTAARISSLIKQDPTFNNLIFVSRISPTLLKSKTGGERDYAVTTIEGRDTTWFGSQKIESGKAAKAFNALKKTIDKIAKQTITFGQCKVISEASDDVTIDALVAKEKLKYIDIYLVKGIETLTQDVLKGLLPKLKTAVATSDTHSDACFIGYLDVAANKYKVNEFKATVDKEVANDKAENKKMKAMTLENCIELIKQKGMDNNFIVIEAAGADNFGVVRDETGPVKAIAVTNTESIAGLKGTAAKTGVSYAVLAEIVPDDLKTGTKVGKLSKPIEGNRLFAFNNGETETTYFGEFCKAHKADEEKETTPEEAPKVDADTSFADHAEEFGLMDSLNISSITHIDDPSFNHNLTESLRAVYENVEKFTMTDCQLLENKLIITGDIKFVSGNVKATQYIFEASQCNNTINLTGINKDLFEHGAIKMTCSVLRESLKANKLEYKYTINNNLVEGLIS